MLGEPDQGSLQRRIGQGLGGGAQEIVMLVAGIIAHDFPRSVFRLATIDCVVIPDYPILPILLTHGGATMHTFPLRLVLVLVLIGPLALVGLNSAQGQFNPRPGVGPQQPVGGAQPPRFPQNPQPQNPQPGFPQNQPQAGFQGNGLQPPRVPQNPNIPALPTLQMNYRCLRCGWSTVLPLDAPKPTCPNCSKNGGGLFGNGNNAPQVTPPTAPQFGGPLSTNSGSSAYESGRAVGFVVGIILGGLLLVSLIFFGVRALRGELGASSRAPPPAPAPVPA